MEIDAARIRQYNSIVAHMTTQDTILWYVKWRVSTNGVCLNLFLW